MKIKKIGDTVILFSCPGCGGHTHHVQLGDGPNQNKWDGDVDSPTITPEICVWRMLVSSIDTCKSTITAGKIRFSPDCTHELAGEEVDLPDYAEVEFPQPLPSSVPHKLPVKPEEIDHV